MVDYSLIQLVFYREMKEVYGLHSQMPPEVTWSLHPIYTLFRDLEVGTVEMGCQDEMVVMESQGDKEKRETLVLGDYLAHKVCTLTWTN